MVKAREKEILYGKASSLNMYVRETLGLLWPKGLLSVDSRNGF
jgi:hypothetical protein